MRHLRLFVLPQSALSCAPASDRTNCAPWERGCSWDSESNRSESVKKAAALGRAHRQRSKVDGRVPGRVQNDSWLASAMYSGARIPGRSREQCWDIHVRVARSREISVVSRDLI